VYPGFVGLRTFTSSPNRGCSPPLDQGRDRCRRPVLAAVRAREWTPAFDSDGRPREGAEVAELPSCSRS